MADSDDDFERRRRDKFRGERADYGSSGRERRDDRRREDWTDSNQSFRGRDMGRAWERGTGRREYGREYGRSRERYSPARHDMSPPMKRMRPDWEERRYPYETNYNAYGSFGNEYPPSGAHSGGPPSSGGGRFEEVGPTQPPMMTFKSFMEQCDDSISEEDALKKYGDYKLEFKRQQLNEFFVSHKEEEWFKAKYHPEECCKRKEEQLENLKRRKNVFLELLDLNRMEDITVDADQSENLLKLLDCVVIKLEGGTDLDLQILDQPQEEDSTLGPISFDEKLNIPLLSQLTKPGGEKTAKQNRSKSDSGASSGSDSEDEPAVPGAEEPPPPGMEAVKPDEDKDDLEHGELSKDDSAAKDDLDCQITGTEDSTMKTIKEEIKNPDDPVEVKDDNDSPKPRPLHKTASIFLRNLAPTITKAEVETMCKRYNGFLRAAIADPQPERRWFRRGWVTFKRDVNIKDICWNLNNIRLRDCELGAIVNRDLNRRIRTVSGITSHKAVVKADIKLAAKIIQNLDTRWSLWIDVEHINQPIGLSNSQNPALKNITDYLIEEASAEEEELLGATSEKENGHDTTEGESIERDNALIQVLDRMLLYLRVVHSVDYYNHSEYPNEDEMPNRCGIIHARGIPPSSKVTPAEITEYTKSFENKIGSFLQPLTKLPDEEAKKLGLKDPDDEVVKFVQSNTQEVSKEKFQCPLCQKKFKAAEFVHKHIANKHDEKVAEVRKEVEYFNNYLKDPKRPQLPEYPGAKGSRKEEFRPDPYVASYPQQAPPPMYGYANYGSRYPAPGGHAQGYGGYQSNYPKDYYREPYPRDPYPRQRTSFRSRSGESRDIVGYQDLDAPDDVDLF